MSTDSSTGRDWTYRGQPQETCQCPKGGWTSLCPVHGDPFDFDRRRPRPSVEETGK